MRLASCLLRRLVRRRRGEVGSLGEGGYADTPIRRYKAFVVAAMPRCGLLFNPASTRRLSILTSSLIFSSARYTIVIP
jgi:hypothetical protein